MAWRLGIDVGGTFTDFALQNVESGELFIHKCLSTPKDPSIAILGGAKDLLDRQGLRISELSQIVHGTTIASNIILERKGAGVGLITTKGFKYILQIGRQKKPDPYDLGLKGAVPLVPAKMTFEVTERLNYDGNVVVPLDREEGRRVVRQMIERGIKSIAVCFLHSYRNPKHEEEMENIIKEEAPEMMISLSSKVCPIWREYERTNTTLANAYVMTAVKDYIKSLKNHLKNQGYSGILYFLQSSGGLAAAETILPSPVRILESGPAGGALVTKFYGKLIGSDNLLSFDMGGTTAKGCVIDRGKLIPRSDIEVDRLGLKPASGLSIAIPAIDLIEIGAGGGSIATVNMGTIIVGPQSAGAEPGPICYGRGGTEPTVTDANLVLGYLNPNYFAGGQFKLNKDDAIEGIDKRIARPLGMDVADAAWGIHHVANLNMELAMRAISVEKGYNPRFLTFVATGGAGPAHGSRLARALGCCQAIYPAAAGVASAIGMLVADISFELVRSTLIRLKKEELGSINIIYEALENEADKLLRGSKATGDFFVEKSSDMRYEGQGYEVRTLFPRMGKRLIVSDIPLLKKAFDESYASNFGYSDPEALVEGVTWYLSAKSPAPPVKLKRFEKRIGNAEEAIKDRRMAYFPENKGYIECNVYDRYMLFPGARIIGPAIIEERESTTVIIPGDIGIVDEWGDVVVKLHS